MTEVSVEESTDGVISVLLDRPSKRNALGPEMIEQIRDAAARAAEPSIRALVLRSAVPGTFCSGFDLGVLSAAHGGDDEPAASLYELYDEIEACPAMTIACADGLARGGGVELIASCDLRVCTPATSFGVPASKLSQAYNPWGIRRYVRVVGLAAATELLLTGRVLSVEDGLRCGLVTRVLENSDALDDYVTSTLEGAPMAQRAMKTMLRHDGPPAPELLQEYQRFAHAVHASDDRAEALAAWAERRSPWFVGH